MLAMRVSVIMLALMLKEVVACEIADFADVDRLMPRFDKEDDLPSKTLHNGQPVYWHIFTLDGRVVSLSREYFTDQSSIEVRILPKSRNEFLFSLSQGDSGPEYVFGSCADGEVATPLPGPLGLTPTGTKDMATSIKDDFLLLSDIEPYRSQLLSWYH